jgi:hypothetical protein
MEELYTEGIKEGKKEGKIEDKIESILKILRTRFKRVPKLTEKAIRAYKDMVALDSLFDHALVCATLAEFERDLAHL